MSETFAPFKTKTYLAIAKEPVYVGTGGYRIGRVDNTIIREPGSNLPKIPGTTISGNARYYSWLGYKSGGMELTLGCAKGKKTNEESACGECEVCIAYGFINDRKAHSGLAYFSDARILFFPVSTMIGTVWVTSDDIVKEFIDTNGTDVNRISNGKFIIPLGIKDNNLPKDNSGKLFLNFGWIMLEYEGEIDISSWKIKSPGENSEVSNLINFLGKIENKVCIVSSEVFHHIVNSNLETRTSVSINPVTGAAESGALFTYEALPRGTVFIMDVTYENPKNYGNDEYMKNDGLNMVVRTVEKGFELFSSLGIGGMGTRGFGKIEIKDNMQSEKEYWESVVRYLKNLENKFNKLNKELNEIENKITTDLDEDEKKELKNRKELICREIEKIKQILNLHQQYIEAQKERLNETINNFKEIYNTISSITLTIPEICNQNNTEGEQNG